MEASAPKVVERPLWVLSRDEQRVLIITFVGGLASIIASVCVLGGAIALARWMRASHYPLSDQIYWTAFYLPSVVIIPFIRRSMKLPRWIYYIWLSVCLVVPAEYMLAWIGLAAGIH